MTDKEIIQELRICSRRTDAQTCTECPLFDSEDCMGDMMIGAADLIERLKKEKAALISTISGFCQWCKNSDADENSCRVWTGCSICDRKCPCAGCRDGSKWEWKGLADAL